MRTMSREDGLVHTALAQKLYDLHNSKMDVGAPLSLIPVPLQKDGRQTGESPQSVL